jgi:hypothetical protein
MVVLRLGLSIAAIAFLGSFVLGIRAGFPPEVALVRAALVFMAVSFIAYVGELIIATAPLRKATQSRAEGGEGTEGVTAESADDESEAVPSELEEPLRLPVPDAERQAA